MFYQITSGWISYPTLWISYPTSCPLQWALASRYCSSILFSTWIIDGVGYFGGRPVAKHRPPNNVLDRKRTPENKVNNLMLECKVIWNNKLIQGLQDLKLRREIKRKQAKGQRKRRAQGEEEEPRFCSFSICLPCHSPRDGMFSWFVFIFLWFIEGWFRRLRFSL